MRALVLSAGFILLAGACATPEGQTPEPTGQARTESARAAAQQRCGPVEVIQVTGSSGTAPGDYLCQRERDR